MSQWGRFLAKRTNLAFLNEINAIWFPYRNRLSFSARRIKRRRQSRSGAPAQVVKVCQPTASDCICKAMLAQMRESQKRTKDRLWKTELGLALCIGA